MVFDSSQNSSLDHLLNRLPDFLGGLNSENNVKVNVSSLFDFCDLSLKENVIYVLQVWLHIAICCIFLFLSTTCQN